MKKPAAISATRPNWPAFKIERRAVSKLVPYEKNARTHTPEQIASIAQSIREWGWTTPILVDEGDNIIAGHARYLAANSLAAKLVPVIVARGWSDEQKRAYVLADNQLALNSGWDRDLLKLELGDLRDVFDMSLLGFSPGDLQNIFLDHLDGETDANAEWQGMPGFEHGDKRAFRSIVFHFTSQEAVDELATLIGRVIGEHARYVWFPEIEIETYADKRWVDDGAPA